MEKEKKEKTNELEKKVSTLTMCMVVMGVLVLSLGGYLLYDKVGSKSNAEGSYMKQSYNREDSEHKTICGYSASMLDVDSVIRIMRDGVALYDTNKNQIATLNKGDELYPCSFTTNDYVICKSYIRLNTDKFVDGTFVVEYNNCKNFVYLK